MASLVSCQNMPFFIGYKSIDNSLWDSRDTIVFDLPTIPANQEKEVELQVGIRTLDSFEYSKMSLKVELCQQDSVIDCDTVTIALFNSEGKPTNTGFPYIESVNKGKNFVLKHDVQHRIRITHIMRLNSIKGIYDVGVALEEK